MAGGEHTSWRMIDTGARPGAENMALDIAVARLLGQGATRPTIHVYDWSPAAVSIGHTQDAQAAVDLEACHAGGLDVVRRPTGGRAVLHGGDFTFSVIALGGDVIPMGVRKSYAVLSTVISRGLGSLGVESLLGEGGTQEPGRRACFASSTLADLVSGEAGKLVGSAQHWDGAVLLQQTSILCSDAQDRAFRYILPGRGQDKASAKAELARGASCLSTLLGTVPDRVRIVEALQEAFEESLGVSIRSASPTARELELASLYRAPSSIARSGLESCGNVLCTPMPVRKQERL